MASFDDLAFTGPPAADVRSQHQRDRAPTLTTTGTHCAITVQAAAASTATIVELFCRDCNEIPQSTTADGKRCLICGCELERRQQTIPGAMFAASETSVQELQAMVMRLLTEIGNDWNGGGDTGARRPASDEAVRNLGSFTADQASTIEVAVVVEGIKGEVIAIPGNFGPCESLQKCSVVIADPFDGAKPFQNANEMKNKIVVMARGGCTFAQKVLRAQAAGAAGVIIIQTVDVWPYTMTDSTGESKDVTIPAFMMSAKVGKGFVEFIRAKRDESVSADIIVRKDARECVICQVEMSIGMKVTRMPCQHMFHTGCLHEWLQIGNSCPICRVEIAAKRTTHNSSSTSQNAQQRGDFAWSEWFS
ncbi:E3 ubiquitin-protein ligase RING1 [Phytophthora nicotianae]|uniref:RING-type E3 ubiquitin transferase n=1 Tax=Phytophthora nicotianae TaxID=4792 RepID=A0A0W8DZS4_PHYNI|nr:E3 ubiquitin-protein ligase RING1 [Phytophthora nicotianae]